MNTILLAVIAGILLVGGYVVYSDRQAAEAEKDEPIMCIVGASDNCRSNN